MIISRILLPFIRRHYSSDLIYSLTVNDIIDDELSSVDENCTIVSSSFSLLFPIAKLDTKAKKVFAAIDPSGRRTLTGLVLSGYNQLQISSIESLLRVCSKSINAVFTINEQKYLSERDLKRYGFKNFYDVDLDNGLQQNIFESEHLIYIMNDSNKDISQLKNILLNSKASYTSISVVHLQNTQYLNENLYDDFFEANNIDYRPIKIDQSYRWKIRKSFFKNFIKLLLNAQYYRNKYNNKYHSGLVATNYARTSFFKEVLRKVNTKKIRLLTARLGIHKAPLNEKIEIFKNNCEKIVEDIDFHMVHSVDIVSSHTGSSIANQKGAFHIIDINEIPIIDFRVGKEFKDLNNFDKSVFLKKAKQSFQSSDKIITTSIGFARLIKQKFKTPAEPIRNFRNALPIKNSKAIRKDWKLKKEHKVLVHTCSIDKIYGTEILIKMMSILPSEYHLVFVGTSTTNDFQRELEGKIEKLELQDRIHFKGDISDPNKYISYLSGADVGLSIMTDTIRNTRFNLLNRFADLMCASLPIISSYTIESSKILKDADAGVTLNKITENTLAECIEGIFSKKGEIVRMRKNMEEARLEYSEETEISKYLKLIPDSDRSNDKRTCVFVFQRGLNKNRRLYRFANALIKKNWRVICLVSVVPSDEIKTLAPDLEYIKIPTRYEL